VDQQASFGEGMLIHDERHVGAFACADTPPLRILPRVSLPSQFPFGPLIAGPGACGMPEPITAVGMSVGFTAVLGQLARRYFSVAKEVLDILIGTLLLAFLMPLLLFCAVLIKITSRGPVLFSQTRVGRNGKLFRMYKLRTMRSDAEAASGAIWAGRDDPRIIPACRWMRKSHVDELPQLVNVILGQMSLIGPRPERPEILEELEKHYPNVRDRLKVRPGITGLAQIRNGYDTSVDAFREKLKNDLEYIERQNWRLELSILLNTLPKFRDNTAH
jgi:lipopolysaccharide/colanic/teichoic acid biosynthesis glycosyltransferase